MTTTDVASVIRTFLGSEFLGRQFGKYGELVLSAGLHAGALFVMAFCVLPSGTSRKLELNAVFDTGEGDGSDEFVMQDEVAPVLPPAESSASLSIPESNSSLPDLNVTLARFDLPTTNETQPPAPSTAAPSRRTESPSAAGSVEEAVDRVTSSMQGKLQKGDLLVVWLMDASYSWLDDRQRMITRVDSFLRRFGGGTASQHQLLNAVVSFGAGMKEHAAPTEASELVLKSLREVPVDASGKENVFAAVQHCVALYRENWRDRQLMIVVWTDESGDDAAKLEDTIRICRDQNASVSVVGPSAVLGAEMGLHSFVDSQSRQVRPLPIKRGPDSPVPERLELDYWFLTQQPATALASPSGFLGADMPSWYGGPDPNVTDHRCLAATQVALPSWYGGRDLKGLVSGFSPYALTRLSRRTGGTFTLFDRDKDRAPFGEVAIQAYQPDYRSIEEYLVDVQSHPLRQAVMEAVKVTQNRELGPPPTMLFGQWSETPPYGFMRNYIAPAKFGGKLRMMRRWLKAKADRTTRIVEQALVHVSQPDVVGNGLEAEYGSETSPRWRAWYDLTRGRLLATSVRLEEYRLTCDAVVQPGFLDETTNHLILVPTLEMMSDSRFRQRAEKAERLLVRCVRENPGTPWALLAQRELDYGLGISVRQYAIGHVVMASSSTGQSVIPDF
ncbi:MAG: VWA domain-containing protein [Planctomycetes bacterium]|nr:VWA domain-containing protein [Planctomycetota bacterium]MBL7042021.1 VWA domain-containing protein [Pirellulaceae bacterium]